MKSLFSFLFLVLLCGASCSTVRTKKMRRLAKEFSFCRCVYFALPNDTGIHRDLSYSVYVELMRSDKGLDMLDSLAKNAALAITPSVIADHDGRSAVLKECILFYKSAQLNAVVKKIKFSKELQ